MKLEAIFEHVGLSREQIIATVRKASVPWEPTPIVTRPPRPKCLVCGRPIGRACRVVRYKP